MFTVNPIDNALNSLTTGIDTANSSVQTSLNQLTKEADGGMINPASLLKVQLQESIYTTFMTMANSIVKQYGDIDKSIAQNIG